MIAAKNQSELVSLVRLLEAVEEKSLWSQLLPGSVVDEGRASYRGRLRQSY
jgi:hypothetical protein